MSVSSHSPGADRKQGDPNLDAVDWQGLRAQSHRMVDDMIDYIAGIRDRPLVVRQMSLYAVVEGHRLG
jgi:hypothetical protein